MFLEYRDHMIGRRPIKCQDLRNKIKRGELPEFTMSKVDGNQMCPAWHVKGMCNPSCSQTPDHVEYATDEYQNMCLWFQTNWPSE